MRDGYRTKSLERVLPTVQKPGRYVGGEYNSVVKDWDAVSTRVCLAYPDIYDLGMSGLGLAILYHTLNALPDVLAERTYLPWTDMIAAMRATGIPLYSDNEATLLEATLSRGDRRLGRIIERAWELGARFDAWDELRQVSAWTRAFAEAGLSPEFYAHRQRAHDEIFPWEVVSVGVSRAFLWREYQRSLQGETLGDCREQHCHSCGILGSYGDLWSESWCCPQPARAQGFLK